MSKGWREKQLLLYSTSPAPVYSLLNIASETSPLTASFQDDHHHHCCNSSGQTRRDDIIQRRNAHLWQHVIRIAFWNLYLQHLWSCDNVSPGSPSGILMVSRTIQDQQPELYYHQQQLIVLFRNRNWKNLFTDVATCYQDPEPELDMAELELEPAWNSLIFLVRRESWQRTFFFSNPPSPF